MLSRGNFGEPKTLDPQLPDDTFSLPIVRDLFEGLTAENSSGAIEPGIARSWSVSADGREYRFELRDGARWSNGDAIVAAEFVAGLRRAVDPKTASSGAAVLSVIENARDIIAGKKPVETLGVFSPRDGVVVVKVDHAAPYLLQILSQAIAAPVHLARAQSGASTAGVGEPAASGDARAARMAAGDSRDIAAAGDHAGSGAATVYDGPYVPVQRVPGAYTELAKNPFYWRAASVRVARVRYVPFESESSELRAYAAGQLDITATIPMSDMRRVEAAYPKEIQVAPILGTFYLALDLTEPPFKDRPTLREALSLAIDREEIAGKILTHVTPAYSFVALGTHDYTPQRYEWSTRAAAERIELARKSYAAAGYSAARPLHLKLYFNNNDTIRRVAIAVAGSWERNLGVVTQLESDEFRVFLDGRKDHKRWDALRLAWNADYDDASSFLDIFGKANNQDDSGYVSARFDALLDAARTEADGAARRADLEGAERVLLGDYPVIPVYFYTARRLVKPYVGGAAITPLNRSYSRHLYWKPAA